MQENITIYCWRKGIETGLEQCSFHDLIDAINPSLDRSKVNKIEELSSLLDDSSFKLIKNQIKVSLKEKTETKSSQKSQNGFAINLLQIEEEDLKSEDFYNQVYETFASFDENHQDEGDKNSFPEHHKYKPIIAIGEGNFNTLVEGDRERHLMKLRAFDCSIWNFYEIFVVGNAIYPQLIPVLSKIIKNYYRGLYDLRVTYEFFELSLRTLKNSNLPSFGGHGNHILPFTFHSENQINEKTENKINAIAKLLGKSKITWKVLLIDDYSNKMLAPFNKKNKKANIPNKFEVIEHALNNLSKKIIGKLDENSKAEFSNHNFFKIYHTDNLQDAIINNIEPQRKDSAHPKEMYDIILLDYLFSADPEIVNNQKKLSTSKTPIRSLGKYGKGKLHFGIDFIHQIEKKPNYLKLVKGPFNNYWILPISVFTQAMLDELRNEGISFISEDYYLSRGADPINTPKLFEYKISTILLTHLTILSKLSLFNIEDSAKKLVKNLKKPGKKNFYPQFFEFLKNEAIIEQLKLGKKYNSTFSIAGLDAYDSKNNKDLSRLRDHYRELLYNLTFREIKNNEDLIIEYSYVLSILDSNLNPEENTSS
ncbi:MAG: hypothetical protein AAF502_07955 [Bacteroidota bacterium]